MLFQGDLIFANFKSRWTPSWADATQVAGTYLGVQLGYWTIFQVD